jgi:hypothetical protein
VLNLKRSKALAQRPPKSSDSLEWHSGSTILAALNGPFRARPRGGEETTWRRSDGYDDDLWDAIRVRAQREPA